MSQDELAVMDDGKCILQLRGGPALTRAIRSAKSPYNVNSLSQKLGTVVLEEVSDVYKRQIVSLADELGKPVVATGDVHFLDQKDSAYRAVLMASQGFSDADNQAPVSYTHLPHAGRRSCGRPCGEGIRVVTCLGIFTATNNPRAGR